MLQRYLILTIDLLMFYQNLHDSQHFLILYLDQVQLLSDHSLCLSTSQQLLKLYVDLTDVEMRIATENIDDRVV